MADGPEERAAFSVKTAEVALAVVFFVLGAIVLFDSVRIGARWASDGPQTGYFPFYIALLVCVTAAANLFRALLIRPEANRGFVETGQLKMVLTVLVPTSVFAALVGWIGLYVAGLLYIGFFMRRLGGYPWWKVVAGSAGTVVTIFVLFEIWFLVPLPKGALERLLGLG